PPGPRRWPPREPGVIVGWRVVLGEKSYELDFGGRDDEHTGELLELARKLDGKGVFVTGTRVGDVIQVTGMKADEGAYRETRTVEIRGEPSSDISADRRRLEADLAVGLSRRELSGPSRPATSAPTGAAWKPTWPSG